MTTRSPILILLACVAAACSPGNETATSTAAPAPSITATTDPLEGFPPADDAAVPESVSPVAANIDRNLASARVETTTLDPEKEGWDARVVRGWYQEGVLVRLSVSEPTDAGTMSGETIFYIENGELRVVRRPDGTILFRSDGSIERWLDSFGNDVDVSSTQREEQQRQMVAAFERWQATLIDSSGREPQGGVAARVE